METSQQAAARAVFVITQIQSLPVYTVHSRVVYTFWLYGVHFREVSREKTFIPTPKYKYT